MLDETETEGAVYVDFGPTINTTPLVFLRHFSHTPSVQPRRYIGDSFSNIF